MLTVHSSAIRNPLILELSCQPQAADETCSHISGSTPQVYCILLSDIVRNKRRTECGGIAYAQAHKAHICVRVYVCVNMCLCL